MPKIGMEPIRRAETINAALECIYMHGIDHITLDMVAAKAGFSKGIVAYYFKTKKNLVLESLKAFLTAYRLKIGTAINQQMQPIEMLNTIIEITLPPVMNISDETINVSTLNGANHIRLPQARIAKIFVQFISKAALDEDLKKIMQETYLQDIDGIGRLIRYAKESYGITAIDEQKTAYELFALIYGLSFFRTNDFMPPDSNDNRDIAFSFIQRLFNK